MDASNHHMKHSTDDLKTTCLVLEQCLFLIKNILTFSQFPRINISSSCVSPTCRLNGQTTGFWATWSFCRPFDCSSYFFASVDQTSGQWSRCVSTEQPAVMCVAIIMNDTFSCQIKLCLLQISFFNMTSSAVISRQQHLETYRINIWSIKWLIWCPVTPPGCFSAAVILMCVYSCRWKRSLKQPCYIHYRSG